MAYTVREMTPETQVSAIWEGTQDMAQVAILDDGSYIVAWVDLQYIEAGVRSSPESTIKYRHYDADGNALGAEVVVAALVPYAVTLNYCNFQVTALKSGGAVLTWLDEVAAGGSGEVSSYGQIISSAGTLSGSILNLDTAPATTTGSTILKTVAQANGGFITFVSDYDYSAAHLGRTLVAQTYDSSGTKMGPAVGLVDVKAAHSTYTGMMSDTVAEDYLNAYFDVTALAGSGYVMVYAKETSVDPLIHDYELCFKIYDDFGNEVVGETLLTDTADPSGVNYIRENSDKYPTIAALSDGRFIVSWVAYGKDGLTTSDFSFTGSDGVFAKILNADGTVSVDTFQVNVSTEYDQGTPQISVFETDTFAISWTSENRGLLSSGWADSPSIMTRTFILGTDPLSGDYATAVTGEYYVDSTYASRGFSSQIMQDAVVTGADKLALVWSSYGQDGDRGGLYTQTFGPMTNDTVLTSAREYVVTDATVDLDGNAYIYTQAGGINDGDIIIGDGATYDALQMTTTGTLDASLATHMSSIDAVFGTAGADTIILGKGVNNAWGKEGDDTLNGDEYSNTLDGGIGADTMVGGDADDYYVTDNVLDTITELTDEGWDVVIASRNYTLGDNLEEINLVDTGNYSGTGNSLDNLILGNSFNNILNGMAGVDALFGGPGDDSYYVDNIDDVIAEDYYSGSDDGGTDRVYATDSYVLSDYIETLTLQGTANIDGVGNGLNNIMYGNEGNNILDGLIGADVMFGGLGDDTYFVDNSSDKSNENAASGTDTVISTINRTLSANVENLTLSGVLAVIGNGNELDNRIEGSSANNTLNGLLGADAMFGGAGSDKYYVDNTGDTVSEDLGADGDDGGADRVYSTVSFTLGNYIETLELQGTGDIAGFGNSSANTIYGTSGQNILNGGGGTDTLFGGLGDDIYFVDVSSDKVREDPLSGYDTVFSAVTNSLGSNVENLMLIGTGILDAKGNTLNNVLVGNMGRNKIYGYGGNDTIAGGAGNDTLYGDIGDDDYVFDLGFGIDSLVDTSGTDSIVFGAGITSGMISFEDLGADRYYAISEVGKTASQCANRIRVVGGAGGTVVENIIYTEETGPELSHALVQALTSFSSDWSGTTTFPTAEDALIKRPVMNLTTIISSFP